MYNDQFEQNRVQWNGSSYSSAPRTYKMEDLKQPPTPPVSRKAPKKKRGAARAVALVLCCALAGGASGVGGAALYHSLSGENGAGGNSTTILQNGTPVGNVVIKDVDGLTAMSLPEIYFFSIFSRRASISARKAFNSCCTGSGIWIWSSSSATR